MIKFISTIYDDLTAGFWTYNHLLGRLFNDSNHVLGGLSSDRQIHSTFKAFCQSKL